MVVEARTISHCRSWNDFAIRASVYREEILFYLYSEGGTSVKLLRKYTFDYNCNYFILLTIIKSIQMILLLN